MRIRISFSKTGPMQYVGHLDLHKVWERVFRRSGLPLAYSLGFHPQPRLNLACALPLGFTSQSELLDAWLESDLSLVHIQESLNSSLPPGLEIQSIVSVDLKAPALQTQVVSAVYIITFFDKVDDLKERAQKILSASQLSRQRRNKTYDLRPLIEAISFISVDDEELGRLRLQLSAREGATGRPEEFLDEIGIKLEDTQIHRQELIFNH